MHGQPRKSIQRPPHTSQRPQDIHIPLQNHPHPPQPSPPDPIPHAIRHLPISPPTIPRRSTPTSTKAPVSPLQFRFLPPPLPPINPATPIFTRNAALDMKHPMNLLAWRRVEAWKQNAFNWNVTVSLGVSKKAVVRNWLRRRVQAAMREGLKARGRGLNGEVLAGSGDGKGGETGLGIEEGEEGRKRGVAGERDLQGALLIVGDKSLITDRMETVRAKIERVLDQVMLKQGVVKGNKAHGLVTRKAKKGLSALR
ncbi:hypothetical protein B9Z65_7423 [Elsinoe australis]|uniref:Uncharacterized protein n=1 Tax=Elsinoe australis TaxID=40998 RepID=A0A2P7YC46_9PEZI|nr:hypothetical protein B9Z65_7423 [Elsinoe australis]